MNCYILQEMCVGCIHTYIHRQLNEINNLRITKQIYNLSKIYFLNCKYFNQLNETTKFPVNLTVYINIFVTFCQ